LCAGPGWFSAGHLPLHGGSSLILRSYPLTLKVGFLRADAFLDRPFEQPLSHRRGPIRLCVRLIPRFARILHTIDRFCQ
jgi:hypothetical protein